MCVPYEPNASPQHEVETNDDLCGALRTHRLIRLKLHKLKMYHIIKSGWFAGNESFRILVCVLLSEAPHRGNVRILVREHHMLYTHKYGVSKVCRNFGVAAAWPCWVSCCFHGVYEHWWLEQLFQQP